MIELKINLQLFAEEKTEEATPHKKREVRKEGQVTRSTDLNAVANLLAMYILLLVFYNKYVQDLCAYIATCLSEGLLRPLTQGNVLYVFWDSALFMFKLLAPVFLVAIIVGLAVNIGQVGFMFAPKSISPKLSNLNPIQGFQRMFSRRSLVELAKALGKVVVVGWVAFVLVKKNFFNLLYIVDMETPGILTVVAKVLSSVAAGCIGVFFVIAVIDYIFQRLEFRRRIRMTKKEVKDEFKQTEGDPQIRARVKERQRELARHRMMKSVPEATVVITNPTHLAIALKYEVGKQSAPQVLAKGAGYIAQNIIQLARDNKVPVIENKPVAQMLFKTVEIGEEIPEELYKAVAEILATIFRPKKRK